MGSNPRSGSAELSGAFTPVQLLPSRAAPVTPGEILLDKYRVENVIGVGGMGVVVAAIHLQLERRVAIKFLLPDTMNDGATMARFAREARAAAKIQSEHVGRVLDVDELPTGAPLMVLEYLDGRDLGRLLDLEGPLPIERAVDYVLQACEGIAHAHALGIVHRDLKPSNLFLACRSDGSQIVKVLDFGISKIAAGAAPSPEPTITQSTTTLGSPVYMSPEQLRNPKAVDCRADIWALGTILYELVAGTPPFAGETIPVVCSRILETDAPPLGAYVPGADPGLQAVVDRCLQKRPEDRFSSVHELASALAPFAPKTAAPVLEAIARISAPAGSIDHSPGPTLKGAVPIGERSAAIWAKTKSPEGAQPKRRLFRAAQGAVGLLLLTTGVVVGRRVTTTRAVVSQPAMPKSAAGGPGPTPHELYRGRDDRPPGDRPREDLVAAAAAALPRPNPTGSSSAPLPPASAPSLPNAVPAPVRPRGGRSPVASPSPPTSATPASRLQHERGAAVPAASVDVFEERL